MEWKARLWPWGEIDRLDRKLAYTEQQAEDRLVERNDAQAKSEARLTRMFQAEEEVDNRNHTIDGMRETNVLLREQLKQEQEDRRRDNEQALRVHKELEKDKDFRDKEIERLKTECEAHMEKDNSYIKQLLESIGVLEAVRDSLSADSTRYLEQIGLKDAEIQGLGEEVAEHKQEIDSLKAKLQQANLNDARDPTTGRFMRRSNRGTGRSAN